MATPNPFDQFDTAPAVATAQANPFDQFDAPAVAAQPGVTNPQGISLAARQGYGRGGRAPDPALMAEQRRNPDALTRTIQGAIDDPLGTARAGASGFNLGVADVAGIPVDFFANLADLTGAGYGTAASAITGRPAGEFYDPVDRGARLPFSGAWNARMLDKASTALGGGPVTQNLSPNNPAARLAYGIGRAIPGAVGARQVAASAAGGTAQSVVAEAGGDPASQAVAGLLGGHAVPQTPRGRPQPVTETPDQVQQNAFGRDSAGAAAAMPPQLARVPAPMRGKLAAAVQRGDRDMVANVIEAQTLPIPITLTEGQARQHPRLISDERNLRAADSGMPERLQQQNQALIDNLDEIRREVAPNVVANDHVQNGQTLIDSYKALDAPERAAITRDYQMLERANGGQLPLNAKSFVDAADAALSAKLKGRYLPAEIRGDIDQLRESGGMMTFEQYENLRTNLATAARDADRGVLAGGGNAAAAINIVRDSLESMPFEGVNANLKQLADRARGRARARFERIRQDPAYRAAVDDPTPAGELSPFADDFVKKYVVSGKGANLQRMRQNLSRDPIAGEAIAAAALNYVKSKSGVNLYTNEGNFSQHGYNTALGEITPRIGQLVPTKTAEMLQQLGNVSRRIQMRPSGSYVNESNTFTAAAGEAAKGYAEGLANASLPGANLGTFIRNRRAKGQAKRRAQRSLDPMQYLDAPPDVE